MPVYILFNPLELGFTESILAMNIIDLNDLDLYDHNNESIATTVQQQFIELNVKNFGVKINNKFRRDFDQKMLTKIKHQRLVYQHQVTQTKQSISENRCFSDNFSLKSYSVRSCSTINSITFLMIAIFLIESIDSLRITLLDIPSPLVVGESTELTCNYDLEDNVLYSFKWYKDGIEFYRYVPRDYPPIQFLKMSGINVDVHKSTKKSVFLQNVNLSTRGKYRCEISAEAPTFVTAAKEGNLEINVSLR
ncbi:riboflavin kinase [Sarcoptes scabiei]|nr:riboflavin kinase [Sarcoptes scabiei]